MNALRVALATAALLVCAVCTSRPEAALLTAQYQAPQQTRPPPPGEREPKAEREPKSKDRTPPPRPIVPPDGQQQNPALREECAWLGQRMLSLLYRDDAMTGNDFMPFYQRFGCPEEHLSRAFGCVVAGGSLENDALAERVAQCWTDPAQRQPVEPMAAPLPEKPASPPAQGAGTARPADPVAAKPGDGGGAKAAEGGAGKPGNGGAAKPPEAGAR